MADLVDTQSTQIGINQYWNRTITEYPACDDYHMGSPCKNTAPQTGWGMALAELLYHATGYMALCDRDDGISRHKITAQEAMKSASDSDLSENAEVDSVIEHQLSVAVAPPDEFTDVSTVSGGKPRGRQTWRTIVGMAGQPERGPPCYRYDNLVIFVKRASNDTCDQ